MLIYTVLMGYRFIGGQLAPKKKKKYPWNRTSPLSPVPVSRTKRVTSYVESFDFFYHYRSEGNTGPLLSRPRSNAKQNISSALVLSSTHLLYTSTLGTNLRLENRRRLLKTFKQSTKFTSKKHWRLRMANQSHGLVEIGKRMSPRNGGDGPRCMSGREN